MAWRKNRKSHFADKRTDDKKSIHNPNEIITSVEIPMYAPNQGLCPKEYQLSDRLDELEGTFEERCKDFLTKSKPDSFNSSYMDAVIERVCVDAVKYVRVQRTDHVQTIMKQLNDMHSGDYCKCKSKLEAYRKDKERNNRELSKFRKIYYSGTSLAEEQEV